MRFFLNGEDLGAAFTGFKCNNIIPAISLNVRQCLRFNFGEHLFTYPPDTEYDGYAYRSVRDAFVMQNLSIIPPVPSKIVSLSPTTVLSQKSGTDSSAAPSPACTSPADPVRVRSHRVIGLREGGHDEEIVLDEENDAPVADTPDRTRGGNDRGSEAKESELTVNPTAVDQLTASDATVNSGIDGGGATTNSSTAKDNVNAATDVAQRGDAPDDDKDESETEYMKSVAAVLGELQHRRTFQDEATEEDLEEADRILLRHTLEAQLDEEMDSDGSDENDDLDYKSGDEDEDEDDNDDELSTDEMEEETKSASSANVRELETRRQAMVENLVALGFPIEWVLRAAEQCDLSAPEASVVTWILERMETEQARMEEYDGDSR